MKIQISSKNGNTQVSQDDDVSQIQVFINWKMLMAGIAIGGFIGYLLF